jgi:two-component system, OmpR family, response regulator
VAEARILVVDDEAYITDLVRMALRYEGFEVATAATGQEALTVAGTFRPDLVVLDIMLPDMEGLEVCRRLRAAADMPVVFLTARDATEDKVAGLTVGGDDYVTKPFSLEEVIARIRAVLRRARSSGPPPPPTRLPAADLELDEESHEVWRAGRRVQLSPTEFKLLRYLMTNAGRVLSKAQILDHVWNYDFRGDSSIVESYVSYLRRKVDAVEPRLIHTIRSVGYVLRLPDR